MWCSDDESSCLLVCLHAYMAYKHDSGRLMTAALLQENPPTFALRSYAKGVKKPRSEGITEVYHEPLPCAVPLTLSNKGSRCSNDSPAFSGAASPTLLCCVTAHRSVARIQTHMGNEQSGWESLTPLSAALTITC